MPTHHRPNPENCPVCGEDVPRNAKACRGCGACHESGWNELSNVYDGLNLPDYAYDDKEEKIARPKFRQRPSARKLGIGLHWRIVALVLVVLMFACFWKWMWAQLKSWGLS